jgi:D-beta-D-heptose 7-phosphate kinase/D-beta-D-heptose 1-phosphate adenosyltransferase
MMHRDRLRSLLDHFAGKHVLVVGDCMLDEYLWGRVNRISPEAPVMVVEQTNTTYAAGGASNVAVNIVAMDGRASIVAIVGEDGMGHRLREELERQGVRHEGIVADPGRPTTVKTRIIAHNQQVVRVDREERTAVSPAVAAAIVQKAEAALDDADVVVFSDYSKGVLTEEVVAEVVRMARRQGTPVFANPKPASMRHYRGMSLVTLNQTETEAVTGLDLTDLGELEKAGERLIRLCSADAAVVTLGGRGLALFEQDRPWRHLPVIPLEVYDPCGCGDSAIAAAALARAGGGDWVEAATLANLAGNAKVRKLGVVPVTRKEIESVWAVSDAITNGSSNGKMARASS